MLITKSTKVSKILTEYGDIADVMEAFGAPLQMRIYQLKSNILVLF